MFDIGFAELLIVAVVALIVLGPERLPTALRTLGLWLGRIRRSVGNIQREISEELRLEEVKRAAREQQEKLTGDVEGLQKPFGDSLRDEILSEKPRAEVSKPAPEQQASATQGGAPTGSSSATSETLSTAQADKKQASTDL